MCDTIVVTPAATADGVMLFGKNSDREPNEAHHLESIPAQDYPAGGLVQLTYIQIPQVTHTFAVLLAKPFWIWGAEMGVNEHSVAIGNEAVFTRLPYLKQGGLIGMDLLRLGLERAATAEQAVQVMTGLLAQYGQGGNCGFQHPFYYHNSFLIADPGQAWVFETAGPHWAARQVQGVYSISNGLTIGNQWDLASPDLITYAIDRKWCKSRDDFDFARCYSDWLYTWLSDCRRRCQRSTALLAARHGRVMVPDVMAVLRDHGEDAYEQWKPDRGLMGANICMHAGFGPVRASQTTGSMVSHLHSSHPTHFFTASSAPCTSVFKPFWLDAGLPDFGPQPTGDFDPETYFWRHERLHRATLLDYQARNMQYRSERARLEAEIVAKGLALAAHPTQDRRAFSTQCLGQVDETEKRWFEKIQGQPRRASNAPWYARAWSDFNRTGSMPDLS